MDFLIKFLAQLATWLLDTLEALPLYVLNLLLTGVAAFINWVPVPSFVSGAAGYVSSIDSGTAYWLSGFNIASGFTIVATAYTLRFLIRRIPFVG